MAKSKSITKFIRGLGTQNNRSLSTVLKEGSEL